MRAGLVPLLQEDYLAGAVLDPEAMDMDVHAIHWGFIRGMRARGGKLVTDAELRGLERTGEASGNLDGLRGPRRATSPRRS